MATAEMKFTIDAETRDLLERFIAAVELAKTITPYFVPSVTSVWPAPDPSPYTVEYGNGTGTVEPIEGVS